MWPRGSPAICGEASEALGRLRPPLEGALAVLTRIEEGIDLTEKEPYYQHAFKMLSARRGVSRPHCQDRGREGNGGVTLGALGAPPKQQPHDEGRAQDTRERNGRGL